MPRSISQTETDLLNNKELFPDVNDLTKLSRTQDRLISELYLEFQKQLPKFERWMKPIPSLSADDLLNEAMCRICSESWKLSHTKEEIKSILESYIHVCKKKFISQHHRKGILSQQWADIQPKSVELELTVDMIIIDNTRQSKPKLSMFGCFFISLTNRVVTKC